MTKRYMNTSPQEQKLLREERAKEVRQLLVVGRIEIPMKGKTGSEKQLDAFLRRLKRK